MSYREPDLCKGLIKPICQSSGITSISDIAVNISTSERIIISPPNFRKSLGISSIPGALPDFSFKSVFEMDSFVNKIV